MLNEVKFVNCVTPVYSRVMVHLSCVHNRQAMHAFSVYEIISKNEDRLTHTGVNVYELQTVHVQEYACLLISLDPIICNRRQRWKGELCKQLI